MAKLKTTTNQNASSSFLPYDGPALVEGSYIAVLKNPTLKKSKGESGNYYINAVFEVDEPKNSDKAKYNGAAVWGMIHFMSEAESMQARYVSFLKAVGAPLNDPEIVFESQEDADSGKGSKITSIGGVKFHGRKVRIVVRKRPASEGYGESIDVDMISKIDTTNISEDPEIDVEVEDEEIEVEETEEIDGDEEEERAERTAELKKMKLAELKAAALEAEIDIKGLKKDGLIEAIVDWEFSDEDEDEDEDEESEEVDPHKPMYADGDEEEEEEDDEEEEEEDESEALRAELQELDRTALKKRLKEVDPEAKVFKSTTDEAIIDMIVEKSEEAPF